MHAWVSVPFEYKSLARFNIFFSKKKRMHAAQCLIIQVPYIMRQMLDILTSLWTNTGMTFCVSLKMLMSNALIIFFFSNILKSFISELGTDLFLLIDYLK